MNQSSPAAPVRMSRWPSSKTVASFRKMLPLAGRGIEALPDADIGLGGIDSDGQFFIVAGLADLRADAVGHNAAADDQNRFAVRVGLDLHLFNCDRLARGRARREVLVLCRT